MSINAALMDIGNRFRMLVNEVDVIEPPQALPKLPVARAVWQCRPDFKTACAAWIYAGGAHHTGFSYSVTTEHMEDFAAMSGIDAIKSHLGTDPTKISKSRIKRLQALSKPQYRLRVDDLRVYYDVKGPERSTRSSPFF